MTPREVATAALETINLSKAMREDIVLNKAKRSRQMRDLYEEKWAKFKADLIEFAGVLPHMTFNEVTNTLDIGSYSLLSVNFTCKVFGDGYKTTWEIVVLPFMQDDMFDVNEGSLTFSFDNEDAFWKGLGEKVTCFF